MQLGDGLADRERFLRTVTERYRDRIGAYEVWDMADHPDFFSGRWPSYGSPLNS